MTAVGVGSGEAVADLLDGSDMYHYRFYRCWLLSLRFTQRNPRQTITRAELSDLGRSVMLMMQATREREWIHLPFATITALHFGERPKAAEQLSS